MSKKNTEKQKQEEKLKKEMSKRFCAIRMSCKTNQQDFSYNELADRISIAASKRPEEELGEKLTFCPETYRRWEKGEHLRDLESLALFSLYLEPHPNLNYLITGDGPMFLPLGGPQFPRPWDTLAQRLKAFRENQPNPLTGKSYKVREIAEIFECSQALWRKYERPKMDRLYKLKQQKKVKLIDDNSRSVPLRILYRLHTMFGVDLNLLICGV